MDVKSVWTSKSIMSLKTQHRSLNTFTVLHRGLYWKHDKDYYFRIATYVAFGVLGTDVAVVHCPVKSV